MKLAIAQIMPKLKNVNVGVYQMIMIMITVIILRMRIIINYPIANDSHLQVGSLARQLHISYITFNMSKF